MEKEDEFIPAIKAADVFSVDRYLALHWGWPYDVALKGGNSFARYSVKGIYELTKRSCKRYNKIAGEVRPMVLSELNADGDVTGPYDQAKMFKEFCDYIKEDKDKWLSGFTFYQFRDEGRLGLEINDPNNKNVGIALVTVKGKGDYKNLTGEATFKITLKKIGLRSLSKGKEGEAKASWNIDTQADGYELSAYTNKGFGSGTVKAKVTDCRISSYLFESLKSKKKYYIRIRSYKKVGSSVWYSTWSAPKEITVP